MCVHPSVSKEADITVQPSLCYAFIEGSQETTARSNRGRPAGRPYLGGAVLLSTRQNAGTTRIRRCFCSSPHTTGMRCDKYRVSHARSARDRLRSVRARTFGFPQAMAKVSLPGCVLNPRRTDTQGYRVRTRVDSFAALTPAPPPSGGGTRDALAGRCAVFHGMQRGCPARRGEDGAPTRYVSS
jgi:hypothetical protein